MARIGSAPEKSIFPPFMLSLPVIKKVEKGEKDMNDLTVKNVNLFGDTVVAAQDKDGVIWAGVKWFCDGLGLSKDRAGNERKKIQEDVVLSQGVKFYPLGTGNANKDVLCLKLDFVPL